MIHKSLDENHLASLIELFVCAPVIGSLSLALEDLLLAGCTQVLIMLPQASQDTIVLHRVPEKS